MVALSPFPHHAFSHPGDLVVFRRKIIGDSPSIYRRNKHGAFKARSMPELIAPPSQTNSPVSVEQAYLIQDRLAEKLINVLGPVKGYKVGFASESVFEKLGISEPAYGRLYADQIVEDSDTLAAADFFVFNMEAEVAFKIGKRIDKEVQNLQELKNYIQSVHAGFDISNNWYDPAKGGQTVSDFIANSGGSHYFVLGPPVDPNDVDVDKLVLKSAARGRDSLRRSFHCGHGQFLEYHEMDCQSHFTSRISTRSWLCDFYWQGRVRIQSNRRKG
jgi:2-keto-4-pentenoate hydratase